MRKPPFLKAWPVLCAVVVLAACQKDVNPDNPEIPAVKNVKAGVIADDPAKVSKIPLVISQNFMSRNGVIDYEKGKPSTDATPPTVAITSPGNGSTVSGNVIINVSASDNVKVNSVSLIVDGVTKKTLSTAPYSFTWAADGNAHTITAMAKDGAGNSASHTINVNGSAGSVDNTAPYVSITSPADGSSVSGTVSVNVNASDNVAVSTVTFSVDGIASATTSAAPYTFSWNSSGVADGTHTLTATAKDAAGNSSSYTVTVAKNSVVIIVPPSQLPSSIDLMTPVPSNQGNENSCVAFAIAYGARSIEQFYGTGAGSYNLGSNVFSPEYAYNLTKFSDCGSGTALTSVLDLIQSQGVSTWQSMPYSDLNGCALVPDASQQQNAANYKINSYVKIVNSDQAGIKGMLASHHPVIATIFADNGFMNAGANFIWSAYSGSGNLAHAIVITGYDDSKQAYKVMNSWGTGWGDGGFSWINYDFFPQKSSYYTYAIQ